MKSCLRIWEILENVNRRGSVFLIRSHSFSMSNFSALLRKTEYRA